MGIGVWLHSLIPTDIINRAFGKDNDNALTDGLSLADIWLPSTATSAYRWIFRNEDATTPTPLLTSVRPYEERLGVVEEDALADLLLVDGSSLVNLDLIFDPHRNLRVIMKDGKVYKNNPV